MANLVFPARFCRRKKRSIVVVCDRSLCPSKPQRQKEKHTQPVQGIFIIHEPTTPRPSCSQLVFDQRLAFLLEHGRLSRFMPSIMIMHETANSSIAPPKPSAPLLRSPVEFLFSLVFTCICLLENVPQQARHKINQARSITLGSYAWGTGEEQH